MKGIRILDIFRNSDIDKIYVRCITGRGKDKFGRYIVINRNENGGIIITSFNNITKTKENLGVTRFLQRKSTHYRIYGGRETIYSGGVLYILS